MKKIWFLGVIVATMFVTQMGFSLQFGNSSKIISQYEKIFNKDIFDIRIYNNKKYREIAVVHLAKRSDDIKKYADFTAKFDYRYESGEYKLLLYDICDYSEKKYTIFNDVHKKSYNNYLSKKEEGENLIKNIVPLKKNVYWESVFPLPFVGEKYLGFFKKDTSRNFYYHDKLLFEKNNIAPYLILFEPIKAKIIIKPQTAIEIYKDIKENIVFRKLQKIENLDFNNLNTLKEFAKEKLDEFLKETDTLKENF